MLIQRNRIENTGMAGILVGFDTSEEFFDLQANPEYYESIRAIVRNNIVRYTGYAGIGLYAARDAQVLNNTITDAGRLGHAAIYFGIPFQDWDAKAGRPPSVNPVIRNNLIVQDGGTCVEIRWTRELGGFCRPAWCARNRLQRLSESSWRMPFCRHARRQSIARWQPRRVAGT